MVGCTTLSSVLLHVKLLRIKRMKVFHSLLCLYSFAFVFNLSPCVANQYNIAYYIVCEGDRLIKVSNHLIDTERMVDIGNLDSYQNTLGMAEAEQQLTPPYEKFLTSICTDDSFKDRLMKHPLLPGIRHGYVMVVMDGNQPKLIQAVIIL